jgi:hypothetical protein
VSDSKQWALEKMKEANTIFEPGQVSWRGQLRDLLIWTIEVALICYLAFRIYS